MKKLTYFLFFIMLAVNVHATSIAHQQPKKVILSKSEAEKIGITVSVTPNPLTTYTIKVSDKLNEYKYMNSYLYSNDDLVTFYRVTGLNLENKSDPAIYTHSIRINNKFITRISLTIVIGKISYGLDIRVNDL